ncbi:unnamed protein product, partial [Heterosigma akashiwo]
MHLFTGGAGRIYLHCGRCAQRVKTLRQVGACRRSCCRSDAQCAGESLSAAWRARGERRCDLAPPLAAGAHRAAARGAAAVGAPRHGRGEAEHSPSTPGLIRQRSAVSELQKLLGQIVRVSERQLRGPSQKTKVAVFGMLRKLCLVLNGGLGAAHMGLSALNAAAVPGGQEPGPQAGGAGLPAAGAGDAPGANHAAARGGAAAAGGGLRRRGLVQDHRRGAARAGRKPSGDAAARPGAASASGASAVGGPDLRGRLRAAGGARHRPGDQGVRPAGRGAVPGPAGRPAGRGGAPRGRLPAAHGPPAQRDHARAHAQGPGGRRALPSAIGPGQHPLRGGGRAGVLPAAAKPHAQTDHAGDPERPHHPQLRGADRVAVRAGAAGAGGAADGRGPAPGAPGSARGGRHPARVPRGLRGRGHARARAAPRAAPGRRRCWGLALARCFLGALKVGAGRPAWAPAELCAALQAAAVPRRQGGRRRAAVQAGGGQPGARAGGAGGGGGRAHAAAAAGRAGGPGGRRGQHAGAAAPGPAGPGGDGPAAGPLERARPGQPAHGHLRGRPGGGEDGRRLRPGPPGRGQPAGLPARHPGRPRRVPPPVPAARRAQGGHRLPRRRPLPRLLRPRRR